jgi:hypothetical protein
MKMTMTMTMTMTIIRTTLYLKTASGSKPYKTCYFPEVEWQRLQRDWERYQLSGEPVTGTYQEEVGVVAGEQLVLVEFSAIALIKAAIE